MSVWKELLGLQKFKKLKNLKYKLPGTIAEESSSEIQYTSFVTLEIIYS